MVMLFYFIVFILVSLSCSFIGNVKPPIDYYGVKLQSTFIGENNDENTPKSFFLSKKSFSEIGLTKVLTPVLSSLSLERPSKIQAITFNTIFNGTSCIVADQTGSGKTLAYLLPVIQRVTDLKAAKLIGEPLERRPYIVIVAPTTELANQVSKVVKSISNVLKFRSACFTSSCDMDSEQKKLRLGCDILVSTPGRLVALLQKKDVAFDRTQTIILDEADVLFSDVSFPLQPIGDAAPASTQFVFVTATLPDQVTQQIKAEFPGIAYLTGPGLHRIAPTIKEVLIDCSGPPSQKRTFESSFDNKREALFRSMDEAQAERTLIFCNTIAQCRNVENALLRVDRQTRVRDVYVYHSAVGGDSRDDALDMFSKRLLHRPIVMICTDRASRGLDFDNIAIDHVVLFDFPQEPSEYVRRVGRTGRAGRFGRATVLVQGRQVPIAKQIISASIAGRKIEPAPELNAFDTYKGK